LSQYLRFPLNRLIIYFGLSVSRNYTAGDDVAFWTSGVDVFKPRDFYWDTTGVSLNETYSNWAAGEPNDFYGNGTEHCVEINSYKSYDWNDRNCDQENYFVCEWHSSCNNAAF